MTVNEAIGQIACHATVGGWSAEGRDGPIAIGARWEVPDGHDDPGSGQGVGCGGSCEDRGSEEENVVAGDCAVAGG